MWIFNLIPLTNLHNRSLEIPFIKGSAKLSFNFVKLVAITLFEIKCLMLLCLWCICLDLPLYIVFWALVVVDWLSQWVINAVTYLYQHDISSKRYRCHWVSSFASSKAMNSDSIVDIVIQVCLEGFHETTPPLIMNTYPLVDLDFFVSDIQFASLYHSSIVGYLP